MHFIPLLNYQSGSLGIISVCQDTPLELFYAALIGSGIYNTIPVFVGATVGALALIGVYFGLNKITKIIPIGMFFRASSILLFALAIYFAYEGIHELHEGVEELASITTNILLS